MKSQLQELLHTTLSNMVANHSLVVNLPDTIQVDVTKDKKFGDYASNIALMLAKEAKQSPRVLAEQIVKCLPSDTLIKKAEIAGPGFINFFLSDHAATAIVPDVLEKQTQFGRQTLGQGQRVLVEFVSANPTGPLHIGHGRGAAFGATISNLLEAMGFDVHREYYVNDAGRQMNILATSVWLRYLALHGAAFDFPTNGYKGDYVIDMAQMLNEAAGNDYVVSIDAVYEGVPKDARDGEGDKEAHVDALILNAKHLLGEQKYRAIFELALQHVLGDIKEDLSQFGVDFSHWYHESSLVETKAFEKAIEEMKANNVLYEHEGATWFKASQFGDEKDRVVFRENGEPTYFAIDIAYHLDKYRRGFNIIIDVFGADHHGYFPRLQAALRAFGHDTNDYIVKIVQFANLYRGGERVQMSTRSGSFVTLRELRDEVGNDAARFFYIMRKNEQHMDFDLDLATSKSNENPVYYIQYAYARICSVMRQLGEKGWVHDVNEGNEHLARLTEPQEKHVLDMMNRYQDTLQQSALLYEPHALAGYLRELANALHSYYNSQQFLVEDSALRNARLNLIVAVRILLKNGLTLLGVNAPESM